MSKLQTVNEVMEYLNHTYLYLKKHVELKGTVDLVNIDHDIFDMTSLATAPYYFDGDTQRAFTTGSNGKLLFHDEPEIARKFKRDEALYQASGTSDISLATSADMEAHVKAVFKAMAKKRQALAKD